MQIVWKQVADVEAYVCGVLRDEADDIPQHKTEAGVWYQDDIACSTLTVDSVMLADHDSEPVHIQRRDDFVRSIEAGSSIYPLIALGPDLFLVDGYARYRALRLLGVITLRVFRQRCAAQLTSESKG